jgi:uncharacterized membrane protein required for colicin V production
MNYSEIVNWLQKYHWLDITIVVVVLIGALIGTKSGVMRQIVRLVNYVISVYATLYFHEPVRAFLKTCLTEVQPVFPKLLSCVLVFLAVYLTLFSINGLARKAVLAMRLKLAAGEIENTVEAVGLGPLDRLLGAGVGVVLAGLLLGAGLLGVAIAHDEQIDAAVRGSQLRPPLMRSVEAVLIAVPQQYKDELSDALKRFESTGTQMLGDLTAEGMHNASRRIKGATDTLQKMQKMQHELTGAKPQDNPGTPPSQPGASDVTGEGVSDGDSQGGVHPTPTAASFKGRMTSGVESPAGR